MSARTPLLSIACDDGTELQRQLNYLYEYKNDILTKVFHRSRIALFQRIIRKLIGSGVIREFGSALDIGCNAGFYCKMISDMGFRDVLGIDICAKYVNRANREFASGLPEKRVAFQVMDAADLFGAQTKRYNLILCTEVIEHTDDPDRVIQSILDLLVPGGTAVISLPNCLSFGYLTTYVSSVARGRELTKELRDHLSYPFYKGPSLFRDKGASIVCSSGVNCLFNNPLLLLLHRTSLFALLNSLNFWLSSRWPFKWASQFFFFVITKNEPQGQGVSDGRERCKKR